MKLKKKIRKNAMAALGHHKGLFNAKYLENCQGISGIRLVNLFL